MFQCEHLCFSGLAAGFRVIAGAAGEDPITPSHSGRLRTWERSGRWLRPRTRGLAWEAQGDEQLAVKAA